jgi:hypothetical protein
MRNSGRATHLSHFIVLVKTLNSWNSETLLLLTLNPLCHEAVVLASHSRSRRQGAGSGGVSLTTPTLKSSPKR